MDTNDPYAKYTHKYKKEDLLKYVDKQYHHKTENFHLKILGVDLKDTHNGDPFRDSVLRCFGVYDYIPLCDTDNGSMDPKDLEESYVEYGPSWRVLYGKR